MNEVLSEFISRSLAEDIGSGDHSTLACVPENAKGEAVLLIKEKGVLAGVELAEKIIRHFDPNLIMEIFIRDGEVVSPGDVAFKLYGPSRSILTVERLLLNCMQRMSGIATKTNKLLELIKGTNAVLLDSRKTTPGIRFMEKWAVRIGGGQNHRMGLYDMIMLKDNHIDYAGGIEAAIKGVHRYLKEAELNLRIEVEVRNLTELDEVLRVGGVDRIMLDNFSLENLITALKRIPDEIETEASGGITEDSILSYAETGVDFISVGALTHSVKSLDMSLKASFS